MKVVPSTATPTRVLKIYLVRFIMLLTHNPPNLCKASIPAISTNELYRQYCAWCSSCKQCPLSNGRFRSLYGEAKQEMQVAVRASKHGSSKCTCCTLIESQLARATSMVDKGLVQAIKLEHLAFHAAEAKHYENHSFAALDDDSIMSLIMDGADQSQHDVPQVRGRKPKDLETWPQKIQGTIVHGTAVIFHNILPMVKTGANLLITTFMRILDPARGCSCCCSSHFVHSS